MSVRPLSQKAALWPDSLPLHPVIMGAASAGLWRAYLYKLYVHKNKTS